MKVAYVINTLARANSLIVYNLQQEQLLYITQ